MRRATSKDEALVYPIGLRERLPRIPIPLAAPDPDLVVDLQSLVERVYVAGAYGVEIDYAKHPEPRLGRDDLEWARGVLGPST